MTSISPLNNLGKEIFFQHSKICFTKYSKEDFWQNALDKMLDTQIGPRLLKTILDNPNLKILKLEYQEKNNTSGEQREGKNGEYSIVRGSLANNNYYIAKNDKYKYVAEQFRSDQILFHELFHVYQHLRDGALSDKFLRSLPLSSRDFDNRVEEEAVFNESQYLIELGFPQRIDHHSSHSPSCHQMLNKPKEEQIGAFLTYLVGGIHFDALKLSEKLSNKEIEDCFNQLSNIPLFDLLNGLVPSISKNFIDLVILLIEKKELKISFDKEEWKKLLPFCLRSIDTLEQFHKLEKLGVAKILEDELLHFVYPKAKEYFSIINYLVTEKNLNINYIFNDKPFFLNDSIRYTLKDIELLDKLGANFQLKDDRYHRNMLFFLHPCDEYIDIISFLVNVKKININERNWCSKPFFCDYTMSISLEQLKALEKLGADFSLKASLEENILFHLNPNNYDFIPIVEYLTNLTEQIKLDINKKNSSGNPFFFTGKNNFSLNQLKSLENLGADFTLRDYKGMDILFHLNPNNYDFIPIVEYLTEQKDLDINRKNRKFGIPFFLLQGYEFSLEQLKSLKSLGTDFTLQNDKGENILFYLDHLSDEEYIETFKYLLKIINVDSLTNDSSCGGRLFWDGIAEKRMQLLRQENLISDYSKKNKRDSNEENLSSRKKAKASIAYV